MSTASDHPLAVARESAGLSRDELAEKAGVTRATIERIEHGLTRMPQEATLDAIADAVGIAADRLERQIVAHRRRALA